MAKGTRQRRLTPFSGGEFIRRTYERGLIKHGDLIPCAQLFESVFNASPWNESWKLETVVQRMQDFYDTPGFRGIVATIQDEPAAFLLGHVEQWDEEKHFCLPEMCVVPERQNGGLGTALLKSLEESLGKEDVTKIYLYTARDTLAHSFYRKQGFHLSSRMILMTKRLP